MFRKLVLNWLAEIIDGLPQEDNGLLTLPLLLKLSHAIIDIGRKKRLLGNYFRESNTF